MLSDNIRTASSALWPGNGHSPRLGTFEHLKGGRTQCGGLGEDVLWRFIHGQDALGRRGGASPYQT